MSDLWISVVIPTFNRRESLRITLDGLSRQTLPFAEFEVIVVSDGSTDGTNELLDEYSPHAPYKLRGFVQENGGPARARNRGIEEAAGELIVLLDDDVEPAPDFLAAHARRHRPVSPVGVSEPRDRSPVELAGVAHGEGSSAQTRLRSPGRPAIGATKTEDELAKLVVIGPMLPDPGRREPAWIVWEHAMLRKQYDSWESGAWTGAGPMHFYSGNASFRREWAIAVGGFNEDLKRAEDVDLGWRMQRECGVRFEYDPAPIGIHRPTRSFQSWLNVADSYGRLDVVRARSGDHSWELIRNNYITRNRITRILADITLAIPAANGPLRTLLLTAANVADRVGARPAAIVALSAIYNLRYLESVRIELGLPALRRLISDPPR